MGLRDYLNVLRKRWTLVVAALFVCVIAGSLFVVSSTKKYEATAQIFVSTAGSDGTTAADLAQGNTFAQARVQSYTSVATSPTVTDEVVKSLNLRISSDDLAKEITADAPLNKILINLHVTDRDPVQAARLANAVAQQFTIVVQNLEQTNASTPSPVKLTVTHPAQTPTGPVTPRTKLDIAIAVLVGLVLGLGLAFLRELLDNTIKDPAELAEFTSLPVLGIVPWDKRAVDAPVSFRIDTHGSRAEGYRQLRTNLQFVDIDKPPKIIAVTSALPKEGKTHTSLNLAAALAESGQRVCLIEADLRKPTFSSSLGVVGRRRPDHRADRPRAARGGDAERRPGPGRDGIGAGAAEPERAAELRRRSGTRSSRWPSRPTSSSSTPPRCCPSPTAPRPRRWPTRRC